MLTFDFPLRLLITQFGLRLLWLARIQSVLNDDEFWAFSSQFVK